MSAETIEHLRGQVIRAIASYEAAKRRFASVTRSYTENPRHKPGDAETLAAGDWRRRKAIDDCQFAGAEMERYGTALLALALTEPRQSFGEHAADAVRHTIQEVS